VTALALSRGGRHLFTGTNEGAIVLWDLLTNEEVGRLAGHRDRVCSLAVSANGRELASASDDTTILLWDIAALVGPRPRRKPTLAELRGWWAQLAESDPLRAYRAAWALAEAPDQTVAFLGEQLRPVRAPGWSRRARLTAELDGDEYEMRERAERELDALDTLAVPALRAALRQRPSLEQALRARRLLDRIEGRSLPAQQVLAVGVLADIGSPAARLLRALAEGAPEARLTRQAKAALERLGGAGP
jgi:WD domain, G-beta repeat